ncbi:uncharacterized protein HaLaN_28073, partial [Haematococcus lacustris]
AVATDIANAVSGGASSGTAPLLEGQVPLGASVGDSAGKGFGFGDYYAADYYDYGSSQAGSPATTPSQTPQTQTFRQAGSVSPTLPTSLAAGSGLGGNSSRGEVAPFCQPPLLRCSDRDLLNFLATQTDNVVFPDNVLEYNAIRFRPAGANTYTLTNSLRQIGGPVTDFSHVLNANWRLRSTLALVNGLNGIGTNTLSLGTLNLDSARPDRLVPDSFSFNLGGITADNSLNSVRYVPSYTITGTGPGLATTSSLFGPFTTLT